ncbi:MAG TPA: hypothetical protein VF622_00245, partial [Segetibacter sp.]
MKRGQDLSPFIKTTSFLGQEKTKKTYFLTPKKWSTYFRTRQILQLLCLIILIPTFSIAQIRLQERFVRDAINENNYIDFNHDSTFKYRLAYHTFHDISCGDYKVIKDTIFLYY